MSDYCVILSGRGLPLIQTFIPNRPTITIENYQKWYSFYVVFPDGRVEEIHAADHGVATESPYGWSDHVPHPYLIKALAEKMNYNYDPEAYEIIAGRWTIETMNRNFSDTVGAYIIPKPQRDFEAY